MSSWIYRDRCTLALRDIKLVGADVGKQQRENMIYVSVSFNFILLPGSQVQGWVIHYIFFFAADLAEILISDGFSISGQPRVCAAQLIRNALRHLSRV